MTMTLGQLVIVGGIVGVALAVMWLDSSRYSPPTDHRTLPPEQEETRW